MDPGILKHPDENQLYLYATETYMHRVYTIYNYLHDWTIRDSCMQASMACVRNSVVDYYYITLPLQGQHKHLASRSIHMDCTHIPRTPRWTLKC